MRLKVELTWHGGIVEEGDRSPPPEPEYELFDADTGRAITDRIFRSCVELEAYIEKNHPGCPRWMPPPPPPEDAALLERVLAMIQGPDANPQFDPRHARSMLAGHLYQWGHPPETVERLRRALGLTN